MHISTFFSVSYDKARCFLSPDPARTPVERAEKDTVALRFGKSNGTHLKVCSNDQGLYLSQGDLPDCQLLAVLYALSIHLRGRALLNSLIERTLDGDYLVTFKGFPNRPILVNAAEAKHQFLRQAEMQQPLPFPDMPPLSPKEVRTARLAKGDIPKHAEGKKAIRILETAYAHLQKRLEPDVFEEVPEQDILRLYNHPDYHYTSRLAFQELTGWEVRSKVGIKADTLDRLAVNQESCIIVACSVCLESDSKTDYLDPGELILQEHAYGVERIDPAGKTILLRDPHNTEIGILLSYRRFLDYFDALDFAIVPKGRQGAIRMA